MNRLTKLAGLLSASLFASNSIADTVSIGNMDTHDLKSSYFKLDRDQKVEIEFLAPKRLNDDDEDRTHDFVWIIDLDSRETMWRSHRADVIESTSSKLNLYGDKVSLDKGRYGLFFATYNFRVQSHRGVDFFMYGLSVLWRDGDRISREDIESFYVDLRAEDIQSIKSDKTFKPFGDAKELVSLNKVRKNRFKQFGMTVDKDTDLSIYALGEIAGRDEADSAWLKNADTGKIVWKLDKEDSRPAGGARKNRMFKGTVPVTKGSYVLSYSSDGSHHYNDWNAQPPFDPKAWGVSVYANKDAKVEMFDPKQRLAALKFLDITEVGDNDFSSKHFKLDKDTPIRVVALGERANSRTMVDYGWIVDNSNGDTVWKMRPSGTEHAGGSDKNRITDKVITLPKGEYTVNYVSDGSHSYDGGWNASRPHDESLWGITLYGASDGFDKKSVKMLKSPNSNALAQITRVTDGERRTATFELEKDQKVRIYAIGEGDSGDMADYGYIKDTQSGKRVWYMFADETEHAGGAGKNRRINQVVSLKKGKYKVYFRTDGSHAFGDWNAQPPSDQHNYGITVFPADK